MKSKIEIVEIKLTGKALALFRAELKDRELSTSDLVQQIIDDRYTPVHVIYGNITYDSVNDVMYRGDNILHLTKTEKKFFKLLWDNKNELVSIEDIIESIWAAKGATRFVIRNNVFKLRTKIGLDDIIINNSNNGYKLNYNPLIK